MTVIWLLTVWLAVPNREQTVFEEKTYLTQVECLRWQEFYSEYPFKSICTEIKETK